MRFLGHVHEKGARHEAVSLLRSKGIPTYEKFSGVPSIWPPYRIAIYVCLDEHYEDALELLRNPNHRVANPVNVAEFDEYVRSQPMSMLIIKWGALALFATSLLLVAMTWLFFRY